MTVLNATTDREAWLAERRKGIGASEIAAVLGISPWESPFSLWWRKREGWEIDETDQMHWGTVLEPVIADEYARRLDGSLYAELQAPGLVVGPEPWMLATPDRIVVRSHLPQPEFGWLLELKTAHSAHDGWGEPGTDEIPVHYRAQVLWQMLCTGYRLADVAVLIAGSDYREYTVKRDEKDIAVMVEAGRRFMASLEAGDPPPLDDHEATLAAVKLLRTGDPDGEAKVGADIAHAYRIAVRKAAEWETAKRWMEARLRWEMGDAKYALDPDGGKVATRVIAVTPSKLVPARAEYMQPERRSDYLRPAAPKGTKS